jgi:aspartate aminotransferase
VSLGVGAFRDNNGKPVVLSSIREAQRRLLERNTDMEYSGIDGVPAFIKHSQELVFGEHMSKLKGLLATSQTLSGTGALRLAFEYLNAWLPKDANRQVFVPKPTWANHKAIIQQSGLTAADYRYYKAETNGLDLDGLVADLGAAPARSVVLLHACAHNPTGVDPTPQQWKEILKVCKAKDHFIVFDSAYQGFASGDPEKDSFSYKLFLDNGVQYLLCQSFAKNMGLYGYRTGALHVVCGTPEEQQAVLSQLKILVRPMYSNPPVEGARIAAEVLGDPQLKSEWHKELKGMAGRIQAMRQALVDELKAVGSTKNWSHITDQIGMFCFTGLNPKQVQQLREEQHIYMTNDGRISLAGLNTKNVKFVAQGIHNVTK